MKNVLVVGFGGAGMSIAEHIQSVVECHSLAVNTDSRSLSLSSFEAQLLIGADVCHGESAGVPRQGQRAVEESIIELEASLAGYKTIVLVAGLGGGTGTAALPIAAELPSLQEVRLIEVTILPFQFEGNRRDIALDTLADLQSKHPEVLVYDNQLNLEKGSNRLETLPDAFEQSAQLIAEDLQAHLVDS